MAIKYIWKEPFTPFAGVKGADPQVVGDAIQKIKDENGGELRPRLIWQAAKAPRHPLHKFYVWEEKAAAEKYWDHISRKLAGSIRIVGDDKTEEPAPAFISIRDDDGVRYRTLDEVLDSADLQSRLLEQADQELKSFERRYRMLSEVCEVIRKAREVVAKRRGKGKPDDDRRPTA